MEMAKSKMLGIVALGSVLVLGGGASNANTIKPFFESVQNLGPNDNLYTYKIEFGFDSMIISGSTTPLAQLRQGDNDGDYFAFFDIHGYIANSAALQSGFITPTGTAWSVTEYLTGFQPHPFVTASGTKTDTFGDDPSLWNVRFQLVNTGSPRPEIVSSTSGVVEDPSTHLMVLGEITFRSAVPVAQAAAVSYVAQDANADGEQDNSGQTRGPASVPAPAAAWSAFALMGGMLVYRGVKRRASAE